MDELIKIPYKQTGQLSGILQDYFSAHSVLNKNLDCAVDWQSLKKAIAAKQSFAHRTVLVETLLEQYKRWNVSSEWQKKKTIDSILSLKNENTFTVTTGHQLCFMSGPLFSIYKIASTIKLSQMLKEKYPSFNFIPIFWLAGEDHDFQEISSVHFHHQSYGLKAANQGACGTLSAQIFQQLSQDIIQDLALENPLKKVIQQSYQTAIPVVASTYRLLMHLFEKHGLVILDSQHAKLKGLFKEIMKSDILDCQSYQAIQEQEAFFQAQGYNKQAHIRPINFFYLDKQIRERIIKEDKVYKVLNTDISFSQSAMESLIDSNAQMLSPNVLTRPLYQECILPNIAYVGGPSELVYWFQIRPLFEHYKIPYPVPILRDSFLQMQKKAMGDWQKMGFTIKDLFETTDTLKKQFLFQEGKVLAVESLKEPFDNFENLLLEHYGTIDPTLHASIQARGKKYLNDIKAIEKKVIRYQKTSDDLAMKKIEKIKAKAFPNNHFQERWINFLPYYLKDHDFVHTLIKHCNPLKQELKIQLWS